MKKNNIAVKVENVSKSFVIPTEKRGSLKSYFLNPFHRSEHRKFDALKDISFKVKKGEFIGIIGENGSGKSTLLKILAGIYQPDKGKVTVNGKIVPFLELGVGFNPELSGRENIFLNGTILGMSRKYLNEKFDEIVDFAEVREFIDMPLKNYSSGMQVRLAFAITTVTKGDVYLMDEVIAVGDENFQRKCLEILNELRISGKTILFVSHNTNAIGTFCKKVLLLKEGRCIDFGQSQTVIDKYMLQNMESFEKGTKEKRTTKQTLKKYSDYKIEDVIFLDKQNKESSTFRTNEPAIIKILFKAKKAKNIGIGISFETDERVYLCGWNTRADQYNIKPGANSCRLVVDRLNLLKGNYKVNVSLFNTDTNLVYDFVPRMKGINVFSFGRENLYKGYFSLKHRWV